MDQGENHITYTARDIQNYLEGKLAPSEMHAMEKAALDDPFLAEAMEGYDRMKEKDWESELALLRNELSKKETNKAVLISASRRYTFWKAAAAVLILFGGIAITYILTRQPAAHNSIASFKAAKNSTQQTATGPVTADTVAAMNAPTITESKTRADASTPPVARKELKPAKDDQAQYPTAPPPELIPKDSGDPYFAAFPKPGEKKERRDESVLEQKGRQEYSLKAERISALDEFSKTQPNLPRKFTAQVVGPDGTPLPFANVTVTNQNIGTYADAKGNFRLVSADSLLNVDIRSVGYITKNLTIKSDVPENKIVLTEDEGALSSNTVVAGKAKKSAFLSKQRSILIPDSVINVEPEDGWSNYDTYITNNLFLPDDVLERKIHGEVEVSFAVKKNGLLSNVKVDKSLCGDCDEAALKVIREGPRWKVKQGGQGTGRVKVRF